MTRNSHAREDPGKESFRGVKNRQETVKQKAAWRGQRAGTGQCGWRGGTKWEQEEVRGRQAQVVWGFVSWARGFGLDSK